MQKFIINITQEDFSPLDDNALECFILPDSLSKVFISRFAERAKDLGKLTLATSPEICRLYHLDGVVADFSKSENIAADFEMLRQGLEGKFFGLICRNRRHEAMLVSECEPDFVIFRAFRDGAENIMELTSWYNEMFLLQSALLPCEDGVDFSAYKTDFVILDDTKYKFFVAKA